MTRYRIDPERSRVWIDGRSSVHPIKTSTSGLEGWIELRLAASGRPDLRRGVEAHVEFPVDRLRSSNPLEDRELRRRIDARHHPRIEGTVSSVAKSSSPGRLTVTGDVTFRGVTRPHTDELEVEVDDAGALHLAGSSSFDIREFGMEPPKILMLRVEPVVQVRIDVVALPED